MARSRSLPVYGGLDDGPRPGARDAVLAAFRGGIDAVTIADHVARGLSAVAAHVLSLELPGEPDPACRKGCSHCCHVRVEVTAPEVFLLARALREAGPEVLQRVAETAETTREKDSAAYLRARIRCALLDDDGTCSVYDARPLSCRRAHSSDVDACIASYGDAAAEVPIPVGEALSFHTSAVVVGYYEGAVLAGRPPHLYELHAALSAVLADPAAEARFARGQEPFAAARSRDAEELVEILGRAPESPRNGQ